MENTTARTQRAYQIINDICEDIKSTIGKAFPAAKLSMYTYGWCNIYDRTGNQAIGCEFRATVDARTETAPSHDQLGSPFVTNTVNVAYRDGAIIITHTEHSDRVPVNYISHPKESKKNVTIGQAFKRKVDKMFDKMIATKAYPMDAEQIASFEFSNSLRLENKKFDLAMRSRVTRINNGGDAAVSKVKMTFYHGDVRIGVYDKLYCYLRANKSIVIGTSNPEYPILST